VELNTNLLRKVFAMAGSDFDGEVLASIRTAKSMLDAANLSFTDVAQSIDPTGSRAHELSGLRTRLAESEQCVAAHLQKIKAYQQELTQLRRAGSTHPSPLGGGSLKRTRAEIEDRMRTILGDALHANSSDREIGRLTGISPQAVGNWRRRLKAEREAVHNGRRRPKR
jgi:hypothetical protein